MSEPSVMTHDDSHATSDENHRGRHTENYCPDIDLRNSPGAVTRLMLANRVMIKNKALIVRGFLGIGESHVTL